MRPGLPPFGQHCQPSHVGGQVLTDVDLVCSVKNINMNIISTLILILIQVANNMLNFLIWSINFLPSLWDSNII